MGRSWNRTPGDPEDLPSVFGYLRSRSTRRFNASFVFTNPEDGKPDNFQVWKSLLYPIDNDHSFVQPVAKEQKQGWFSQELIVQVKTMLYVMDHMKEAVPEKIRNLFLSHDIGKLLEEWVYNLKELASSYRTLFQKGET